MILKLYSKNKICNKGHKLFKFVLIIAFSGNSFLLFSQDFNEYYKKKLEEYNNYVDKKENEFRKYIEERDREFSEKLKSDWEYIEMMRGKIKVSEPKPSKIPVYDDSSKIKFKIIEYNKVITDTITYKPSIRKVKPTEAQSFYKKVITAFYFYGQRIKIEHEDISAIPTPVHFDNISISDYWTKLNEIDFSNCIPQLIQFQQKYHVNDWGYYLMVRSFAKEIMPTGEMSKLIQWYLMLKSGYNVKIGYSENQLVILVPFNTDIYEVPYYIIDNEVYYVFETRNPGAIKSYSVLYPTADRAIEPAILFAPTIQGLYENKSLYYTYMNHSYPLSFKVNKELIGFYNSYPLMKLDNYFNSVMTQENEDSVINFLKKRIKDMTEEDAVNFVLHFTQTAFKYKTDNEQFGKEKIFFPDEMFYYNYSDCEDRSVFFAYVLRKLMNLDVIGLEFPDHVAVAVKFSSGVEGNKINWKGNEYVVCDPTYVNAPIGKIATKHLNEKPDLIEINN